MYIGSDESIYRTYLRKLNEYPLLEPERERVLLCTIHNCEASSPEYCSAFSELVTSNLRLVVSVVKHYANGMASTMDLIQDGTLGLITAIKKFDIERGFKLSTYATWWIRQAVQKSYQKQVSTATIPQFRFDQYTLINAARTKYRQAAGEDPTYYQLAEMIGNRISSSGGDPKLANKIRKLEQKVKACSENSLEDMEELDACKARLLDLQAKQIESICLLMEQPDLELDACVSNGDGSRTRQMKFSDVIPDPHCQNPEEYAIGQTPAEVLYVVLGQLPFQERFVLECRFGVNGTKKMTLRELSERTGVSQERVRQIQQQAMQDAKYLMLAKGISSESIRG